MSDGPCEVPKDEQIADLIRRLRAAERARDEAVEGRMFAAESAEGWKERAEAATRERDEALAEVERQAKLRRIAEDAIPRGIEMAKQFLREEYELRMEASVELATCLSNLLNVTTSQDGGGYCSICNCCHSPGSARCWGTRSLAALSTWRDRQ